MSLCEGKGVFERMSGNPLFSLIPLPPPRTQWGSSPRPSLCSLQDKEGTSLSKMRRWFLGRGGSLDEEAVSGQVLFCPHVPPEQQTQGLSF